MEKIIFLSNNWTDKGEEIDILNYQLCNMLSDKLRIDLYEVSCLCMNKQISGMKDTKVYKIPNGKSRFEYYVDNGEIINRLIEKSYRKNINQYWIIGYDMTSGYMALKLKQELSARYAANVNLTIIHYKQYNGVQIYKEFLKLMQQADVIFSFNNSFDIDQFQLDKERFRYYQLTPFANNVIDFDFTKKFICQMVEEDIPFVNFHINNVLEEYVEFNANYFSATVSPIGALRRKLNKKKTLFLIGESGLGKTYRARKIALDSVKEDSAAEDSYELVWWLDADDEKIKESLVELADKLLPLVGIDTHFFKIENNISGLINVLYKELENLSWLIIFDNACDDEDSMSIESFCKDYLKNLLIKKREDQHILLTSRNDGWQYVKDIKSKGVVEIISWNEKDIRNFFKKKPEVKINTSEELSNVFGGLPVVIALIKRFIVIQKIDLYTYLSNWKNLSQLDSAITKAVFISYNALSDSQREVLDIISCLGPDEIPIQEIFMRNEKLILSFLSKKASTDLREDLKTLCQYLLLSKVSRLRKLYSIHRSIRASIDSIKNETSSNRGKNFAIKILNESFMASGNSSDDKFRWELIPHIDYICKDISNRIFMNEEEKVTATHLVYNSALFHYNAGEIQKAEDLLNKALNLVSEVHHGQKAQQLKTDIYLKLSNTLFLKGKYYFEEALSLASKALTIAQNHNLKDKEVVCHSEALAKIYQRKCLFNDAERELLQAKKLVEDNPSDLNLQDKLAGIYHNLGSLYWTRGAKLNEYKNDYLIAVEYFSSSIEIQNQIIADTKIVRDRTSDPAEKGKLDNRISTKKLYLNVSRMILGAVYGLMADFESQQREHKAALSFFEKEAKEKRRCAYTAYYILSYGWDQKALKIDSPSCFIDRYSEEKLLDIIIEQDTALSTDEKYQIILKILNLRIAVITDDFKNIKNTFRKISNKFEARSVENAYSELISKLIGVKFGDRFYDVDTCSVSVRWS
ncbi:tetratricopeptide repeat protein [Cytophagaceae bacterium YF14B1]|uniref:Tetratricopeptide repeat protein n=1 Tax=Xanthocytophaga flava TaxID=3048013 RepID=A0AAE3R048_9BACT|nr:tetratricopeptide repeat protein [Xanthocytophaga flavus]MDJ1486416.1 tetratricopeptide repeat protein [Xanthocytophaga flavus]